LETVAERRRGQAVVEFALVLPVLILLLLGTVEFGRFFDTYLSLQHAAREGARLYLTGASQSVVEARIRSSAYLVPQSNRSQISITLSRNTYDLRESEDGSKEEISVVGVSLSYPFAFVFPFLGAIFGNPVTVSVSLEMGL
jgi:hypothetical protein